MNLKKLITYLFIACLAFSAGMPCRAQFLSSLDATKADALFTTYAAPLSRSEYKTDQGYRLLWNDDESGIELISSDGGNSGVAFRMGGRLCFRLKEIFREPVVTCSYSDILKYYFYPFKDLRAEVFFAVYSSGTAILEIRVTNEGHFPVEVSVIPYYYFPSSDSVSSVRHEPFSGSYTFPVEKKKDGWMKEHDIPFTEHLSGYYLGNIRFDSVHAFLISRAGSSGFQGNDCYAAIKKALMLQKRNSPYLQGLILNRTFRLQPGDQTSIRIVFGIDDTGNRLYSDNSGEPDISARIQTVLDVDLDELVREDEQVYSRIPRLNIPDRDRQYLYWSCFSLLRQCMMPPEGKCRQNYYVFSREPKWGWGYGGQVFHESLAMLAYAFMDPGSAMNSQRVYFDRQHPDGYINYRTGPYLDETIETNGMLTSSAPWFSYENLEVYKVTNDRRFLEEAYESGRRFYRYYVASRDSNSNGLCEWGAHAELESVRDARVAIWDQVGWPSNFEGPDVNSMLVMEAKALAEMARILGRPEESRKWIADARSRTDLVNQYMWDRETGFYYNINRKDQRFTYRDKDDLKRKEIIGFLPLWAGIPDTGRAAKLLTTLKDPAQFWRPFGVPTLSAGDPYYNPMGYWNGPVWVQWDYLLFRGLLDYGYKKEAAGLADKVLDNMIWHLKNDHVFWEFYSPDDRQAGWNMTYIWAGIAARFLIDLDRDPFPGSGKQ